MTCDLVRPHLEAFVDRELPGAEMLRVSQHIDTCDVCAAEVTALADLGQMLRGAVSADPVTVIPDGMAAGVVARIGAEAAQSWRALFSRAVEDWHWAVVGAGSVAATFVSAVIVAVVVMFGPAHERGDSLAALMSNLQGSPGELWIEGRRVGIDARPVMMRVGSGRDWEESVGVVPASFRMGADTEADLVLALLGVVDRGGLTSMTKDDRLYAQQLLAQISALRTTPMIAGPAGHLIVYRLRLAASTSVSAKMLNP
jgi:hypothetical protein